MSGQQTYMPEFRERRGKQSRQVKKPFEVWYRYKYGRVLFRDWCRFGRYKDRATAEMVVAQKATDTCFEYEIRGAP